MTTTRATHAMMMVHHDDVGWCRPHVRVVGRVRILRLGSIKLMVFCFFLPLSLPLVNYPAEYSDSGHCRPCHSTCETCTGSTEGECLSCSASFMLQHNKCVTSCDDGYYMETGGCAKCLHTCTQCVSRMNCTQCAKGLLLQSGECRTTCADG